jgi:hypothetical protein
MNLSFSLRATFVCLLIVFGMNLSGVYAQPRPQSQGQAVYLPLLLGGVLIGVLENVVGYYFSPAYKEGVALMLFLVVILFRPEGLLGKAEERKV